MTTVTTYAGVSGAMEEVVFGPQESAAEPEGNEAHVGPSPYDYLLLALGA